MRSRNTLFNQRQSIDHLTLECLPLKSRKSEHKTNFFSLRSAQRKANLFSNFTFFSHIIKCLTCHVGYHMWSRKRLLLLLRGSWSFPSFSLCIALCTIWLNFFKIWIPSTRSHGRVPTSRETWTACGWERVNTKNHGFLMKMKRSKLIFIIHCDWICVAKRSHY